MATHTTGPWEVSGDGVWGMSPWNARVKLATINTFASMNGIDWLANARLVSAAPDMHAAICTTQCPYKANGRPDDFTALQCFEAKECGCDLGASLAKAAGR